jgi:hypothetical protein
MLMRRKLTNLTNLTIFGELFYFIIHCWPLEAHSQTIYEDAMTLTIMAFSIRTLSSKSLYVTLSIKGIFVTLSITGNQHANALHYAECNYADYHYSECLGAICKWHVPLSP